MLVNPDNTLTPQGIHVRNCIQNGAALAAGAILLGTPPYAVVKALPLVARLGGCEGVINFYFEPWTIEESWKPNQVNALGTERKNEPLRY